MELTSITDSSVAMTTVENFKPVIVRFRDVEKTRGPRRVLEGLNFELQRGEIVCLLGPNGAGKSTTIQHLLGLMAPDRGVITVFDRSPNSLEVRRRIGCTPQDTSFLEHATLRETLTLVAAHYPQPSGVDEILEKFGLSLVADRQTQALSGGQRRCLALACAFIGNPELVLLDEPTTGLDVDIRRRLWAVVREYSKQGGTVLLTTHYLEEAEELATRILVIHQGRVLTSGDVASIKSRLGMKQIEFFSQEEISSIYADRLQREQGRYRVWTSQSDLFIRELAQKHQFSELEVKPVKLEDAFLMLLNGACQ